VGWAQDFAAANRGAMLRAVTGAVAEALGRPLGTGEEAISCHHNYVARERHFGADVLVTRKGAVNASAGRLGIIPGSMGKRSYIVRGKGHPESFESCSHGAGRAMSRNEARRRFTLADLARQTEGVECRKDDGVLDEIPGAYKDLDLVMAAQADLVDVVHTLRAVLTVKG
jgi:tRNA-splicing ligase RtcB